MTTANFIFLIFENCGFKKKVKTRDKSCGPQRSHLFSHSLRQLLGSFWVCRARRRHLGGRSWHGGSLTAGRILSCRLWVETDRWLEAFGGFLFTKTTYLISHNTSHSKTMTGFNTVGDGHVGMDKNKTVRRSAGVSRRRAVIYPDTTLVWLHTHNYQRIPFV